MRRRKLNIKQVAALSGINAQTISNARRGVNTPRLSTAAVLADVLGDEHLTQIVAADRRGECDVCGSSFITDHTDKKRRRFCTKKCQQLAWNRNATDSRRRQRSRYFKKATMQLKEYQMAVEAMCRSCEPVDFICRDGECPIQVAGLSPFPLQRRRAA